MEPRSENASTDQSPEYEPPRVEEVFDSSELAREIHYAGVGTASPGAIG